MPSGVRFELNGHEFEVLSEYRGVESAPWDRGNHPAFDVFMRVDGGEFAKFDYFGSIYDFNEGKDELEAWEHASVAQMLMSDAATGYEDFEAMLANFGSEDNKESRRIYRGCVETYDKFDQILRLRGDELIDTYNTMIDFENEESRYGTLKMESIEIDDVEPKDFEPSRVETFDWSKMNWWDGDNENLTEQAIRRKYEDMKEFVQDTKSLIDDLGETFENPGDYDWESTIDDVERKLAYQDYLADELSEESANEYAAEYNRLHSELISEMRALEPDPLEVPERVKEVLSKFIDHAVNRFDDIESRTGINFEENEFDESLDSVVDGYYPMMNAAWRLDSTPSDADVLDVLENAPNVSIVTIGDDSYITINGAGFDMSNSIAYAYLKIDGEIPKELGVCRQRMSGSEKAFEEVTKYLNDREIKEMASRGQGKSLNDALGELSGSKKDLELK